MSDKSLFRKSALDKLASPEQLDVLMQVTTPRGWMVLLALGVVLFMIVLWGVFGRLNETVDGQGILIRGDAVLAVPATSSGQISAIHVRAGDRVEAGQVVAEIAQGEMQLRLSNQRDRLRGQEQQHEHFLRLEEQNLQRSRDALDAEIRSQRVSIRDAEAMLSNLAEREQTQLELVDRGLLTRSTLVATRSEIAATRQGINRSEVRLAQIETERSQLERQVQQQSETRLSAIEQLRREIIEMESREASSAVVVSPYAGRVLEVTADIGNMLSAGMNLMTLESEAKPLEAVLYVNALEGKRIMPGMSVRVSPSTVKAEEFGFILGEVRSVSEFPVSPEGLRRVLRNESLVNTLAGDAAPVEVTVQLLADPATPSGFKWSSSMGPPAEVFSGTISSGSVIVDTRRPVSYVIPIVKQSVGLE